MLQKRVSMTQENNTMPKFDHTALQAQLTRILDTYSKVPMRVELMTDDDEQLLEVSAGTVSICGVQICWNRVYVYREGELFAEMNLDEGASGAAKIAISLLISLHQ